MKKSIKVIVSILFLAFQADAQLSIDSLQFVIEREVNNRRSVSITAGVLDADKKQVISAGRANKKKKDVPGGNTVYEIGSITKVFTSLLLADMVVRKQINLDDPISKFLPASVKAPTRNGKEITLRSLATHTSALPDLPTNMVVAGRVNPYAAYTVKEAYVFLSNYTLSRDVGSKYEYSNYGAALLGHILTIAASNDYESLVKQRICAPLKMKRTSIAIHSKQGKNIAAGYDRFGKPVASYNAFDVFEAAAAIRSTVNDLLKFASANLGLTRTSLDSAIRLSHTLQDTTGMANLEVALGWHSFNRHGRQILWHNGQTGGFKSFLGLDKEKKRAIVILANGGNPVDDIGFHALHKNYKLQSFKYPWLIKDTITSAINEKGINAAIQLYYNLKKDQKPEYVFNELQLTLAGAEQREFKKMKEAIAIAKLNTDEYPKSWRAFNNLGDIYIADSNGKLAIEAYEKSLEINPNNPTAVEKLKTLKSR
jgi:CubicO group peptidase (beta-lactamase class C family)